eukprot:Gb_14779 [translate_table: standard]
MCGKMCKFYTGSSVRRMARGLLQANSSTESSFRFSFPGFNGRKLLEPVSATDVPTETPLQPDMVVIIAALLCALICVLGLGSMVRCALRCSRRAVLESPENVTVRLANTGMKKKAVQALPAINYCTDAPFPEVGTDCPICLAEFAEGEKLRMLPKCQHCFHVGCIDTWLLSHSSCPSCRNSLLEVVEDKKSVSVAALQQSGAANESWERIPQIPEASASQAVPQMLPISCQVEKRFGILGDRRDIIIATWNYVKMGDLEPGIHRFLP